MFVSGITSGGAIPLLEKSLAFTEARNRMLATNVANLTTPGYRMKQLDVTAFQASLREASQRRAEHGGAFRLASTDEFGVDEKGFLRVSPSEEPVENLLFHDRTNARIERQMALLAENAMMNQVTAEMLKGHYAGITKAIRGRVT